MRPRPTPLRRLHPCCNHGPEVEGPDAREEGSSPPRRPANRDPRIVALEAEGYVVVKAKSYRNAQERQRIAESRVRDALDRVRSIDAWAQGVCVEERRVRDRLTFVYGVARAHGASVEELSGP